MTTEDADTVTTYSRDEPTPSVKKKKPRDKKKSRDKTKSHDKTKSRDKAKRRVKKAIKSGWAARHDRKAKTQGYWQTKPRCVRRSVSDISDMMRDRWTHDRSVVSLLV